MRIWTVIVAVIISSCASATPQPSVGTIARIETGLALLEDLQAVGVADSESMNRAARTRVRNVRCASPEVGKAVCTYDTARLAPGEDWVARRRSFVRQERIGPSEPSAGGWVPEKTEMAEGDESGFQALVERGLWDPPEAPPIRAAAIPPPLDPPAEETLFAHLAPGSWAGALSAEVGAPVSSADVRRVTCVGLQTSYMLCAWEQRLGGRWRRLSQYADISQTASRAPVLIDRSRMEP